ncbi:MAG: Uma2 family endonuclease [Myxococcaceae bacterium]
MASPSIRPKIPFTYREFSFLPDDGRRHELIDGDFYVTPAPTPIHQKVSGRLEHILTTQLEPQVGIVFHAPIDVILAETMVVEPDIVVLRASRKNLISKRGIEGPPDLVVEILSPSSKGQDEFLKRGVYARFAIPEYWIVDSDQGWITQLRLDNGAYAELARFDSASTLTSPEFPELSFPLGPIFEPI